MKIPVFVGRNAVELADQKRVQALIGKPNVKVVTERKTGAIRRIIIEPHVQDGDRSKSGGSPDNTSRPVYFERLEGAQWGGIKVLAKAVGRGEFERWDDSEGFNPKRFNPDLIPAPLRQS